MGSYGRPMLALRWLWCVHAAAESQDFRNLAAVSQCVSDRSAQPFQASGA